MVFSCNKSSEKEDVFILGEHIEATANICLDKDVFKELWHGFSYHLSHLQIKNTNEMIFKLGEIETPTVGDSLYCISVTETGACVAANNEKGLKTGLFSLVDKIKISDDNALFLECCTVSDKPITENRMAHFCVFPETELWELHKFIRLCAALKYSHVILEFWGMLKYDVMSELSPLYSQKLTRPVVYVFDNRIQKRAAVVAALFDEMEAYARPEGACGLASVYTSTPRAVAVPSLLTGTASVAGVGVHLRGHATRY